MMSSFDSERILLVDSLAMARRVFPLRLGGLGRKVDTVCSAEEARTYMQHVRPDLILLEVLLPGLDGFSFCRALKEDPATRDIPVIILTDIKTSIHERSYEVGADDYMPKRIDDAAMRIRIQLHLHMQALRRKVILHEADDMEGDILIATQALLIKAQLPVLFGRERCRVVDHLDAVLPSLIPRDRLLVLDMDLGSDMLHGLLAEIRMNPHTAGLPVMLLCNQDQLRELTALEFMVDDVLWKPINELDVRHRLGHLLQLGALSVGPMVEYVG